MKRLLTAAVLAIMLALPAAAPASPSSLHKYGVNTHYPDFQDFEYSAGICEHCYIAGYHQHVRGFFDAKYGNIHVYDSDLERVYCLGGDGDLLPLVGWTNANGSWHKPANATERAQWQSWVQSVVQRITEYQLWCSRPQENVVEIWNEPNDTAYGPTSVDDYYDNIYLPARAGARAADSDINTVVGGLCFGDQGGSCDNDASNWVRAFKNRGYDSQVNAYAVHPYGYTENDPANGYTRQATLAQTAAKAVNEANRVWQIAALQGSEKKLLCTELGRHTDAFTHNEQRQFALDFSVNDPACAVKTWFAMADRDQAYGLLSDSGAVKSGTQGSAYSIWANSSNGYRVGSF